MSEKSKEGSKSGKSKSSGGGKSKDKSGCKKAWIAVGTLLLLAAIGVGIWVGLYNPKTGCRRPLELCEDGECRSDCEEEGAAAARVSARAVWN